MELPSKIRIGGQELKTQMLKDMDGKLGKCCVANGYIKIAKSFDGIEQTESSILNTFIHEVIHCILDTMGRSDLSNDEVFVSCFAGFLTEAYLSSLNQ